MIEWFKVNWEVIIATMATLCGGLYVPGIRKFLILGVRSVMTEKVMTEFAISVLEKAAKSSKNTVDDAFVAELKSRSGR